MFCPSRATEDPPSVPGTVWEVSSLGSWHLAHSRYPEGTPGESARVAELKKQVESAELKNQRLKEVFQTKIQEFRKVCYTLTGYQIDITTESQYRLTSMYAEHKNDCLIFKVPENWLCLPKSDGYLTLEAARVHALTLALDGDLGLLSSTESTYLLCVTVLSSLWRCPGWGHGSGQTSGHILLHPSCPGWHRAKVLLRRTGCGARGARVLQVPYR
ncbi:Mitotic spindle assembly checkpoint protein MAD1 [Galemys pyrenaicus]|uniref:Mitotic spindle assembly checkpoint protein MAD1 n=1 Tax=Galemys pyrenaicus TaxID=202257 RepID=A0A8J6DKW5_GALPY|nr:Mitotic spindle assembly checkpoint protein MAD1 [Galemys pyrenaicus]